MIGFPIMPNNSMYFIGNFWHDDVFFGKVKHWCDKNKTDPKNHIYLAILWYQ